MPTRASHDVSRSCYLDGAFQQKGQDKTDRANVARWFADVVEKAGQGGDAPVITALAQTIQRNRKAHYEQLYRAIQSNGWRGWFATVVLTAQERSR